MNLKLTMLFSCILLLINSFKTQASYTGLTTELVSENSIDGYNTYRIYANFDDPTDQLISITGYEGGEIFINTSGDFYQDNSFGGGLATSINPALFPTFPDLEFDSWLTIGGEDNSLMGLNSVGLDLSDFEAGGNFLINTDPGGGLFVIPGSTPESFPDAMGRVLLAQLTSSGTIDAQLNVQWRDSNGDSFDEIGETTQAVYMEPSAYTGLTAELAASDPINGFDTYRIYANFSSPDAQLVTVYGQDPDGLELSTTGTFYQNALGGGTSSDISAGALIVDPTLAFDSWVTIGTEMAPNNLTTIGADFTSFEAGNALIFNDIFGGGWFILPDSEPAAFPDVLGRVLIAQVTTDGIATFTANLQHIVSDGGSYISYDSITFPEALVGCTDNTACNYNAAATIDDGSCILPTGCETCSGATDGTGTVVDNDADDDGVCDADEIVGCQDSNACNYNELATDAGSCTLPTGCETCSGATDGTGTVVDNDADDDGVCDADEIVGCQNSAACNYNMAATDSGSCIFATGICDTCSGATDGSGFVVDNDADNDGVCDEDEVSGCTDENACNYNSLATDEDGSCAVEDECGVCGGTGIAGCDDNTALNYNPSADCNDGSCVYPEGGCTYSFALNYNPSATFDDGSCVEKIEGCTDSAALNYDSMANSDDGSCEYPLDGCTDCSATNYNPAATNDDGSCAYMEECEGDFNGDGFITASDLTQFLSVFGLSCDEILGN